MVVYRPCYCTREEVKASPDFQSTAYNNAQVDRIIQSTARNIEGHLHRKFYPEDKTLYFDWPPQSGQGGGQITYPWKLYFDGNDLISLTTVESPPGTSLDITFFNLEPYNYGPPYRYLEIQRDKNIAFSAGTTPQRSIKITGTWGNTSDADSAGTLAAAVSTTTATSINVSDGSQMGVGDILLIDTERLLVQEKSTLATGQTVVGTGITTAVDSDNILAVTSGAAINLREVLLVNSEKLLVLDVTGNNVTVKRAFDGSVLATHSTGATVNAYRTLAVARGQLGSTAATHSNSAPISRYRVSSLIKSLAIAESVNTILQETGGYSDPQGDGANSIHGLGSALADLWDEARTAFGRKARFRTV